MNKVNSNKKKWYPRGTTRFILPNGKAMKLWVGEYIEFHKYRDTDEGYESTWSTWHNIGGVLHLTTNSRSRDCDGIYHNSSYKALKEGTWHTLDSTYRDYSAEAAGY